MSTLDDLGEVISTDVLIVGGGIAGLVAALKAKEYPVDVLIVERQTVGWSGHAPKIGGGLSFVAPEDDPDKFVEFQVRNVGHYLNDQELLYAYARESYGAALQLAEWGASFPKDAEGKLYRVRHRGGLWSGTGVDIDMLLPLRAKLRNMGAKILNKVSVVDLLKQDNRIVGAVGFNIIDGRFYIFKAKATVLANGGCTPNAWRLANAGTGDGIAAAYRAGAEMRNAEFANFYALQFSDSDQTAVPAGENYLFNALGQNITKRYMTGKESDITIAMVLGMEKEVDEGRGPIYMDMSAPELAWYNDYSSPSAFTGRWYMPKIAEWKRREDAKALKYGPPRLSRRPVVAICHGGASQIRVNHEMKTSLDGLWAVGDTCSAGSAGRPGAMRGGGIGWALFSALRGGPSSGYFASEATSTAIDDTEVKQLKENIFSPMQRNKGLMPADAINEIQSIICPIKYNLRRSKDHLEEALSKINEIQQRLPELWAKDGHGLYKCHEAKNKTLCDEMTFRAALMRTESRGSHFREDYPEKDNENWIKWVIISQEAGKMVLFTEPVPLDRYKFKP